MFYTYIIYSDKLNRYYIGSCEDLDIRLQQHNSGKNQSTKAGVPWSLKHLESFCTRGEAYARELQIKRKKSRKYIEWLIHSVD